MSKTTLKPTNMYGNIYEEAHARLSKNLFFNQSDWTNFAKGNGNMNLDMYADVLEKTESWSAAEIDKFYKDYNYTYADDVTRSAALYNEVYGDRTNTDIERERYLRDANGNLVLENGEPVIEKFKASDYDYYKSVINEKHTELYNNWLRQQEVERKESMSGFVKFLGDVAAAGGEFVLGITDMVDGVISSAAGLSAMVDTAIKGGKWEDVASAFVETVSDDEYRIFEDLHDPLVEFEKRYTHLRDLDGNFTNVGKYVVGISNTLGQMVPSMGVGKLIGSIGKAGTIGKNGLLTINAIKTGATAVNTSTTLASAMSQIVYYQGMHSNNIRDMYIQFAEENVSVSNAQILYNGTIKATAEYLIEIGLSKLLGGSIFDDVVFGRSQGKSLGKNLTKSGIARVLKSAGQEGLEEVLQETSGFLVDKAWPKMWCENFGENAELTWQSLFDSFVIGAIVSFAGSAKAILGTSGKGFDGKTALGRKFAAYEYGVNMQSFVKSYNEIMHYEGDTKASTYQRAATQMYASYRMIASIYGEMGETRFKAATKILDTITSDIEAGKFDSGKMKSLAQGVYNTVFGDTSMSVEIREKLKKEIEKAELDEIVTKIEKGEEVDFEFSDDVRKNIEKLLDSGAVDSIHVSKSGTNIVTNGKTLIVPRNYLKNGGAPVILNSISEDVLINNIASNVYFKFKMPMEDIGKLYKEINGEEGTKTDWIRALLFEEDSLLFKSSLIEANKDMSQFLGGMLQILNDLKTTDISDGIYKNKIKTTFERLRKVFVEYCKAQPSVEYVYDFLTDKQINSIARVRWSNNIYNRVVKGETLSATDLKVLNNRIDYLNVDKASKDKIKSNIRSTDVELRRNAMNAIDYAYNKTFTTYYDGKTYMPLTDVPNVVFNNWLQSVNLTLETLLSEESLTEEDLNLLRNNYGEVNSVNIYNLRKEQFSLQCKGQYSFENDRNGKYYVLDKAGERVGYSTYNLHLHHVLGGDDIYINGQKQERKISSPERNKNSLVRALVKDAISPYTSTMLTITDLIQDASLLKEDLQYTIKNNYGRVTPETTFMFLKEYFVKNTGDTSITVKPDGSYTFVKITDMINVLFRKNFKITKDTKIEDLVKPEYLVGMLKDLKIEITDEDIVAEYRPYKKEIINGREYRINDNTIYINKDIVEKGGDYLRYVFLHEFQHAIQKENRWNLGMDSRWFSQCKKSVQKAIIDDIRKHKPELLSGNLTPREISRRVSNFVYHTSGESQAMGLDSTPMVDFYPTIVKHTKEGTEITFPWGSTFNLVGGSKIFGVEIDTAPVSEKLNTSLKSKTSPYSYTQFKSKPKSCFILPDGTLRTFTESEHLDVIKKIDNEINKDYWNTVPQIHVEDDFVSIKITGTMSNKSLTSLLNCMQSLYDNKVEFTLSGIYYDDYNPLDIVVTSDEADSSDDLLDYYSRVKAEGSGKMSMTSDEEFYSDLGEYIPKISLKAASEKKASHHKYSYGSHKYTSKTQIEVNGKIKYVYKYDRSKENERYVSQKSAKGTPLEPFTKKYEVTQMAPELKNFILSTKYVKVAKPLQRKIDKGTLTVADVMDYFRNTDLSEIDEDTFKAINEAFFHNDVIKTREDLQKHVDNTAKYYAARALLRSQNNIDTIYLDDDRVVQAIIHNLDALDPESKEGKLYTELQFRYYNAGKKGKTVPIDANEKYLKWLWMEHYDGSLLEAGRLANIVRYAALLNRQIAGEIRFTSLEKVIHQNKDGDEVNLGDLIADTEGFEEMMSIIENSDVSESVQKLRMKLTKKMAVEISRKYGVTDEAGKRAHDAYDALRNLSKEELKSVRTKQMIAELLGLKFDTLDTPEIDDAIDSLERPARSIVSNMKSNILTIRKNLSPNELKLFLKQNSDLFTDDLKLRPEVYKTTNIKGRQVLKEASELQSLWDRVREIKDDVLSGAYESNQILDAYLKNKKAMVDLARDIKNELKNSNKDVKNAKDVKVVTVNIADDVLEIDTTKPMPGALERILDFEFSKLVKSRTQYLTNDTDKHFQTNFKTFLENNSEYIEALTQEDVNSIIEYYTNSEILKGNISESKYRLYNAVQLYLSVLLLKGNKVGNTNFVLTSEQRNALEKRIELTVSSAAQLLADWKAVMKELKPEEILINSLAKKTGIIFTDEEIKGISNAIASGDASKIKEAKKKAYDGASARYSGRKGSFWNKIYQFERVCMLSGPGTWVRNVISNRILYGFDVKGRHIYGVLDTADTIGNATSKLISKMFPKKFKQNVKGQYKIIGTKVTPEVKEFLDTWLIKNEFLKELIDGLSKYDPRKSKGKSTTDALTEIITKGIATKVFYSTDSNPVYRFVYKKLSDDKYVTKTMLKYLGKMMVEDNVDLSKGLTTEITNLVADAYVQAARDYMHRPNVWNKIDDAIHKAHPAAYFAWKQVFPFASASWNWFVEGLNYTPVGLVKSIINFGRLETTISNLESKRQKGEMDVSSRFAEYTAKRNIGKGVIGTIGYAIGTLLVAFGVVRLDEEDDVYKIQIGDTLVDISGVFSTQGIFMGMSITQAILDSKENDEFDLMKILAESVTLMFNDSTIQDVWNTVRYNSSIGDLFLALPITTLNACIPNLLKTISSVANTYKVKFNEGLLGKIEKLAVDAIPGLAYAFPHYIDPYTGEEQVMYKTQFWTNLANKLLPLKLYPYNISKTEETAVNLGVNKSMLSGRYEINDKKVNLNASDVEKLNIFYGELNKKDLDDLLNDRIALKVKEENGNYKTLKYSKMTEKQKSAAFEQIMSKNSTRAKIKILTSMGYKYYASTSEYLELKKLGITENVYRKTNKLNGFVNP